MAGFLSVQEMVGTPGATWAHRGGSLSFPEHSAYAYQQSAALGYGALEFSCARTSDGVWFGCHDETLNRISGTTGLPAVSSMTWNQVQQYQIVVGAQGAPQPFYKLTDFLSDYSQDYVCIVDHKHAWDYLTEFFSVLDAFNAKSRIVVKYYGDATALAELAASRGYATWGYYYQADFESGVMDARQGPWTLLGMDYGANQAAWDAALSYGKPVVGHIAPTLAAYDTAITKGATMVQVSGVANVPAVGAPTPEPEPPAGGRTLYYGAQRVTGTFVGAARASVL